MDAASLYEWLGHPERAASELQAAEELLGDVPLEPLQAPDEMLARVAAGESAIAIDQVSQLQKQLLGALRSKLTLMPSSRRHEEAAERLQRLAPILGSEGPSMLANAAAQLVEAGSPAQALELLEKIEPLTRSDGPLPHRRPAVLGITADALCLRSLPPIKGSLMRCS